MSGKLARHEAEPRFISKQQDNQDKVPLPSQPFGCKLKSHKSLWKPGPASLPAR